jgi:hypothetical protein
MKKLNLQQGFEVIFSISLVVMLIFPVTIWAQSQMNMDINIQNGDTTVNGKKLHELSPNERLAALNYINRLNKLKSAHNTNNSVATEQKPESNAPAAVAPAVAAPAMAPTVKDSTALPDSVAHALHVIRRIEGDASTSSTAVVAPGGNGQPDLSTMPWLHRFAHRNTQSFSYTYTGSDSITTQINFHVADEATDTLAKKAMLQISDLRLVPEFSTGKTLLMFSLPTKDAADVSLINSEGKSLLSEKTTAQDFSTTVLLPFNGIYFLHVTQGDKSVTKQIIKN